MYGRTYTLKTGKFPSSDGKNNVAYYIFVPNCTPVAILQISHGMCEHIMRYEDFANFLCREGFVVCGNDHLGHGNTAKDESDFGYIAKKDGANLVLSDLHKMTELVKSEFSWLPLILFGHSMGSFYAREYLAKYPSEISAAIISGTAGPEMPTAAGKLLARLNALFCGERNRSKLLDGLSTGSYAKKFPKGSPEYYWISRDENTLRSYAADKFCTFKFTASAYYDLFDILGRVSKRSWAKKLNADTPILLVSGDMDPVGNCGKGVMAVYKRMVAAKIKDVSLKLYPDGHHEMLNELNKYEVYCDILAWLGYHGFSKPEEE